MSGAAISTTGGRGGEGPRVHFFLPGERDLEALRRIRPDGPEAAFRRGERVWILRTYAALREAGLPVELAGEVPDGADVLVFHAKHRKLVARRWRRLRGTVLVAARADGREAAVADVEVVQNGTFADGRRRFFVPHWPQPGLVPRDPERGEAVRTVAYKGLSRHLDAGFRAPEWARWLAERDIVWTETGRDWADTAIDDLVLDWHDYSTVDVVLAVRPHDPRGHTSKPASKLVNAWAAGCPAVLGVETAFRELRRSHLDYIEVGSVAGAQEAVDRLRTDPGLYRAMVENGRRRVEAFTVAAVTERWTRLLFEEVPRASSRGRRSRGLVALRPLVWTGRAAGRLLAGRPSR